MTPDGWLGAVWPFVRSWLPASPSRVAEIWCGPLGGFVPMLRAAGYDAAGEIQANRIAYVGRRRQPSGGDHAKEQA